MELTHNLKKLDFKHLKNLDFKYLKNLDFEHMENLSDAIIQMTEECSGRYISPKVLRKIYRHLVKLRELLFQMETKSEKNFDFTKAAIVERMAIHFLVERCYWIRYNDSEMVSDLLQMLFEVDGHLGKIFDFQQISFLSGKRNAIWAVLGFETTWSEGTLSTEEIQPFVYFLEHTNKTKTLFSCERLAEKYFVQSVQYNRHSEHPLVHPPSSRTFRFPETLVKVLEYGLFVNSEPDQNDIGKLLTGIIGVILNSSQNFCDRRQADYTERIIKAGNALLRAIPHVNMYELLKAQRLTVRDKENMTRSIVQEMSVPTLLPQLKLRCTGPQDLQHLCRRTIRRALYDNWKLPQGITLLPLPTLMKDYINLRYD